MTVRRHPTSRAGVVEAAIFEVGGPAAAAAITNRSESHLRAASNPNEEGRDISFQDVRVLTEKGAMAFLHDLARLAGADLHAVPVRAPTGSLAKATASLMKEAAEAVARISEALEDDQVSDRERQDSVAELLDVQRAVTDLIALLNAGAQR